MNLKKCALLTGILLISLLTNAQKFTISGFIYEKGSKETMPGAVIFSEALNIGTSSNNFGFYSITLPAGNNKIIYQLVGYKAEERTIDLKGNMVIDIDLENESITAEVVISAEKKEKISEDSRMSTIDIPIEQIKSIPALLGEKDVLKVIQLMPGVQKGSEGSSGFYVRGGGPDQNLIILDDATVYNANHLFGFFSIFNGDALKSVELTKGGFPARYGGRLSSVLEMRMKDGNKEKLKGEVGIGLISSRFTVEAPIRRGKSSILVSGRRTYIDFLIYPFLPADAKSGYFFYDFNAKYNTIIDDKNRLFVSGYFGKDKFYFKPKSDYEELKGSFQWGNATSTVRWNHIFSDKVFANASLIFTDYKLGINFKQTSTTPGDNSSFELKYRSGIQDWGAKYDVDYHPNPNHYIRVGASAIYHQFKPSAVVIKSSDDFENQTSVKTIQSYENGIYIEDDWTMTNKLKVNIGMRVSHYNNDKKNYFKPEPRISARYLLGHDIAVKASFATMNQYIHLLSNTGTGLPTDLWVPATARIKPQNSRQVAGGIVKDFTEKNFTISIEGYYKNMNNIISYKEGASFLLVDDFEGAEEINWEDNVTDGKGKSYGAELLIQRKFGKLTGWIGYTLSWTKLQFDKLNNGKEYFARYDRRHDISLVGIYKISDGITLSSTWVYGTGQAISLPLATFQTDPSTPSFGQGQSGLNNFIYNPTGELYQGKNGFRMAAYHRMDIGVQFSKQLKRCERVFELSFYNLYNRKNPFYYFIDSNGSRNKLKQVSLFPILPSVSWTFKF
jgi:hypothetical protein